MVEVTCLVLLVLFPRGVGGCSLFARFAPICQIRGGPASVGAGQALPASGQPPTHASRLIVIDNLPIEWPAEKDHDPVPVHGVPQSRRGDIIKVSGTTADPQPDRRQRAPRKGQGRFKTLNSVRQAVPCAIRSPGR